MCVFVVCLLSNTKLIECTLQSFWLTWHLAQHFAELNLLTHISSCTHLKLYVYRIYISMLVEFVNVCACYEYWVVYVTVKFNSHLLTFSSHHITHITHTQHFKHEPKVSLKSNHFTLWRSDFSHPQTADSSTDSSHGVLQSIEACVVIYSFICCRVWVQENADLYNTISLKHSFTDDQGMLDYIVTNLRNSHWTTKKKLVSKRLIYTFNENNINLHK